MRSKGAAVFAPEIPKHNNVALVFVVHETVVVPDVNVVEATA